MEKTVLILGAGAAGLTTAYEILQANPEIKVVVIDKNENVGGLCRSVCYKNNYIDAGGHRYFTKFERVKKWWLQFLPLGDGQKFEDVMLKRPRFSRIYYLRKFFDYPVTLNFNTIWGLGFWRMTKITLSYFKAKIKPIKPEKTAEDFLINTFGKVLYETFFKNYTEKLWGISCKEISPEWGRERIRGIHFWETVFSLIKGPFVKKIKKEDVFLYPKYGPGQLWEKVAGEIIKKGGEIYLSSEVTALNLKDNKITEVEVKTAGKTTKFSADLVVSSLAIKDLFAMMNGASADIKEIALGLPYRNFRTAAILLDKLKVKNNTKVATRNNLLPDTWIYIQESDVKMGRMQIYNNWSPFMQVNPDKAWIAFEYFTSDTDELWTMSDEEFENLAVSEGEKIGIIDKKYVSGVSSVKLEKAYPAYFGTYDRFEKVKKYTDSIENLYLIGRTGMHKYINIDHAVLSGMEAAKNIVSGVKDKENIWNIDTSKFLD